MAGGNWTAQNKVRPGIYINFSTKGSQALTLGSRGTAAICRALSWGPVREIVTVDAGADTTSAIGWGITTEQARFLRADEDFAVPSGGCWRCCGICRAGRGRRHGHGAVSRRAGQ